MSYKFNDKSSQIETLAEFINHMAEQRITNENGEDWIFYKSIGVDEVPDQLSGLADEVNGKEVQCVFSTLLKNLTSEDIAKVIKKLKFSTWDGSDDYHYIWYDL